MPPRFTSTVAAGCVGPFPFASGGGASTQSSHSAVWRSCSAPASRNAFSKSTLASHSSRDSFGFLFPSPGSAARAVGVVIATIRKAAAAVRMSPYTRWHPGSGKSVLGFGAVLRARRLPRRRRAAPILFSPNCEVLRTVSATKAPSREVTEMAKSWKSVRGVVVFAGAAVIGCGAPDRAGDPAATRAADQATTETRSGALTTSLFQPYVAYPTGSGAEVVGIGDLDGDGRNDVAVLTSVNNDPANDYMVHVFLQDIDGSLKPRVAYPVGARGRSMDIGDVNGDGRADVVVGLYSVNQIGVLLQNATGTLDPMVTYSTPNANQVKVGDFNGDGRM